MPTLTTLVLAIAAFSHTTAPTICIDPGHPSEVGVGTQGKRASEVKVVWEVAQLLRAQLSQDGYRVVLTKSALDEKVLNRRRSEIANQERAKLMVRLHCDAASGTGFAVYYPSQQGKSGSKVGPSQQVISASRKAAAAFHKALAASLAGKHKDNGLKTDLQTYVGGRQGALTGSIYSEVPVLLVEMVVLTNPKDEAFILSRTGKTTMVDALASGVRSAVPMKGSGRARA